MRSSLVCWRSCGGSAAAAGGVGGLGFFLPRFRRGFFLPSDIFLLLKPSWGGVDWKSAALRLGGAAGG